MATSLASPSASPFAEKHREEEEETVPLPPLISLHTPLERTSSTPSSFSPSVANATASNRSYFEEIEQDSTAREELHQDDIANIKQALGGRLHLSKSLQAMRPPLQQKQSGLVDHKNVNMVIMPRAASETRSKSSNAVPISAPSRPPLNQKPSGGFAAFLRKLTGRSASPPKARPVSRPAPSLAQAQAQQPLRTSPQYSPVPGRAVERSAPATNVPVSSRGPYDSLNPLFRAASGNVVPTKANLPVLNIQVPSPVQSPFSAPPAIEATMILPGPTPFASPIQEKAPITPLTDPCQIPLPASPLLVAATELEPEALEAEEDIAPLPADVANSGDESPLRRTVPFGRLAPASDSSDSDAPEDMTDDASESEDTVRELRPLRVNESPRPIPIATTPSGPRSTLEEIVTPTSAVNSPPYYNARFAQSSPPRKAPVGTGTMGDLGRNKSKWRKSMMGLSDTLNAKSVSKRTSIREPPSSHDAYQAHQRRIANNRVSCAPTLHSNASIAAELREIRDEDDRDMAEVFFM